MTTQETKSRETTKKLLVTESEDPETKEKWEATGSKTWL